MRAANTRPWDRDYTIKPGECVPWHLHPDNDDLFICLQKLDEQ